MSRPDPDDALRRTAAGDRQGFVDLYDSLSDLVFGLLVRMLRDRGRAEEVLQETFVEIWRVAPGFELGQGSARAWVVTMARRRAIDRIRSESASRRRTERVGSEAFVPAATPDEAVVARDQAELVRDSVAELSPAQRAVIELAYFDGLTQVEIAERLDIPVGTVKTRTRDGLAKLRTAMERAR